MGQLDDKVIVLTGGSRGLGETMARAYAKQGAKLVLAARTQSDLDRVAEDCRTDGSPDVAVIQTDITDESQVESLVSESVRRHGRIDVFVANAGASYFHMTDKRYGHLTTFDQDIVEKLLKLNTIGTWLCMKHALPVMAEGSSFINIGSSTGRAAYPGSGFYAISKQTIDTMTQMASKEVAEQGIRVNVLCPGGMVDTQLFGPNKMPPPLKERALPDDVIVPAALWLASDESLGVSGHFISGREFNTKPAEETKAELIGASAGT